MLEEPRTIFWVFSQGKGMCSIWGPGGEGGGGGGGEPG